MPEPMLSLAGVNTHIGQYHILQGVDFEVPRGGLTMLLGRNGAGKTTCLRTIMGLWRASAGRIRFDGRPKSSAMKTPDIARLGVAYVPENMGIFAGLTVRENMLLAARGGAPDPKRLRLDLRPVPCAGEVLARRPPATFPAARSRCWRSRARSSSRGSCCWSTSRPRASRRRSSAT